MGEREDSYMGFSVELLSKFFFVDVETGVLYHKTRDISDFSEKLNPLLSVNAWNARWANKKAGNINKTKGRLNLVLYWEFWVFP